MEEQNSEHVDTDAHVAGYLVHGSCRVARMFVSDNRAAAFWAESGEKVEELFTASQVASLRVSDLARIEELEGQISDASVAASETAPSWKHRCHRIMDALGFDYGDPDWLMPGDRRKLEAALARVSELDERLAGEALSQEEVERLLDAEQGRDWLTAMSAMTPSSPMSPGAWPGASRVLRSTCRGIVPDRRAIAAAERAERKRALRNARGSQLVKPARRERNPCIGCHNRVSGTACK